MERHQVWSLYDVITSLFSVYLIFLSLPDLSGSVITAVNLASSWKFVSHSLASGVSAAILRSQHRTRNRYNLAFSRRPRSVDFHLTRCGRRPFLLNLRFACANAHTKSLTGYSETLVLLNSSSKRFSITLDGRQHGECLSAANRGFSAITLHCSLCVYVNVYALLYASVIT